jgi:hypothetical protein
MINPAASSARAEVSSQQASALISDGEAATGSSQDLLGCAIS